MADPSTAGLSSAEMGAAGTALVGGGMAIMKVLDALWGRLTARDLQNTKELIELSKESNKAVMALTLAIQESGAKNVLAIAEVGARITLKFDEFIHALPKREDDRAA